jgi:ribA/ribD-fused uncharacterized protein
MAYKAKPEQTDIERLIKTTDNQDVLLFRTGWSIFSTFSHSPFVFENMKFTTVEQYYQFMKAQHFKDAKAMSSILRLRSPKRCKIVGSEIDGFSMDKWVLVCRNIMLNGLQEKFLQNPLARQALLSTKDYILAEASGFDDFWGTGMTFNDETIHDMSLWRGKNVLGELLMEVRDMLPRI